MLARGKPRTNPQDDPVKWASFPEWLQKKIIADGQPKSGGLQTRTPLRRNKPLKLSAAPRELRRTVTASIRRTGGRAYLPERAGAMWEKKRQAPIRRESPSPAARERRRLIRAAKAKSLDMWEGHGCIGSFLGPCGGHRLEGMHAYSVGAHPEPELSANPANIFPGCARHHRTGQHSFQFYHPWTKALQAAVDLMIAADRNRRPHPEWEELQAEIARVIAREEKKLRECGDQPEPDEDAVGGDGPDEAVRLL